MESKESFVFYKSFYEAIKSVPAKEQLKLYNAICEYCFTGVVPKLEDGVGKGMFIIMQPILDKANARYKSKVENGKKGGRPPKKETEEKPNDNLKETEEKPNTEPKDNLNDNDNDNDNVNVNDNVNDNVNGNGKIPKHKYGEFKNVLLSDEDLEKLKNKFPSDYMDRIKRLDEGIELRGYKYKNHYLAIIKWADKDQKDKPAQGKDFSFINERVKKNTGVYVDEDNLDDLF